ncbi:gephyrin-like molybdotransferase Glp [Algirhabdus cladophorae]|uniref:molybdopterin molybdotransferase MoeA n=1 Tax=Algirhabdus cladophorae TaxID=3377108 RepID=UPI003B847338
MLSVAEALELVLGLVEPASTEVVPLRDSIGRTLAKDAIATRNQPPFSASAMDGYAVHNSEVRAGAQFIVIGEAAAGHGFSGTVGAGQAIRIFTGAPVPDGLDRILIQEDVTRQNDVITLSENHDTSHYIRHLGADFKVGDVLPAPCMIGPAEVSLAAAMNISPVTVYRRPTVAILATGDELVMPGEVPNEDQIVASNVFGLAAMCQSAGANPRLLPIARDTPASLSQAFAQAKGADITVTVGGASVGDHDLVGAVAEAHGLQRAFYKIAMRPGKPLMAGHFQNGALLGLPGNPVSALVCGKLFLEPMIRKMLGDPAPNVTTRLLPLTAALNANGPRAHYMRGHHKDQKVQAFDRQDSALLSVFAQANCLIKRPPFDPARAIGEIVEVIEI